MKNVNLGIVYKNAWLKVEIPWIREHPWVPMTYLRRLTEDQEETPGLRLHQSDNAIFGLLPPAPEGWIYRLHDRERSFLDCEAS